MPLRKYTRWNDRQKSEVALVLLKGELLEEVSRNISYSFHLEFEAVFL